MGIQTMPSFGTPPLFASLSLFLSLQFCKWLQKPRAMFSFDEVQIQAKRLLLYCNFSPSNIRSLKFLPQYKKKTPLFGIERNQSSD
ncbi:hypothetical protein EUGRSUZ_B02357 [Eucalyptus grandis]|uniref:Uncharacterized protein n=2 Tax=Eucalyptus grandis TaxID=71139 RepID=A0ACC3LUK5_EUCGR|nr:hypothetical protein EUGRSUZ_B02357 [Eucalyptus grandis]